MSKLNLSIAIGDYDRNRPLIDGAVQMDGVDPVFMTLSPEEIFFRAFKTADFDICELSLSSSTVKTAEGNFPYVGVPAFLSRCFRHTSIYVRTDRIKKPQDLKGKRIGLPEYQLTAVVWARALLEDEFGVKPSDVTWIRGGIAHAGRPEKIKLNLPGNVRLENAPEGKTISGMLASGEIDAFMAPRAPALPPDTPNVGWLFPDPEAAAKDYYKRTKIFPDHAYRRRAAHACRKASVAAGGGVQGVRAIQGDRSRAADGCVCREGDAAVHRRAHSGSAGADG